MAIRQVLNPLLTLLWRTICLFVLWPIRFIATVLEFIFFLFSERQWIAWLLALWVIAAVWIRFQPEIMDEVDYIVRCILRPLYEELLDSILDPARQVYNALICWWNGFEQIRRIFGAVFLDLLIECDMYVEPFIEFSVLLREFFTSFTIFISGDILNDEWDLIPTAESLGRLVRLIMDNLCCFCNDLCCIFDLIAQFFENPNTHCFINASWNALIKLIQLIFRIIASFIQLQLSERPRLFDIACAICEATKCLGQSVQDSLQFLWEKFIGLFELPDFICPITRVVCIILKAITLIWDIIVSIDQFFVGDYDPPFDQLWIQARSVDPFPADPADRGLVECICDIVNWINFVGEAIGFPAIDWCCAFRYSSRSIVDGVEIAVEGIFQSIRLQNYFFCKDETCVNWDPLFEDLRAYIACPCQYFLLLELFVPLEIWDCICDGFLAFADITLGVWRFIVDLFQCILETFGQFPFQFPEPDQLLQGIKGLFEAFFCVFGSLLGCGEEFEAIGCALSLFITEPIRFFFDLINVEIEDIVVRLAGSFLIVLVGTEEPPQSGILQGLGMVAECLGIPGGELLIELADALRDARGTIEEAIVALIQGLIALFTGDLAGFADAVMDFFILYFTDFPALVIELIGSVFSEIFTGGTSGKRAFQEILYQRYGPPVPLKNSSGDSWRERRSSIYVLTAEWNGTTSCDLLMANYDGMRLSQLPKDKMAEVMSCFTLRDASRILVEKFGPTTVHDIAYNPEAIKRIKDQFISGFKAYKAKKFSIPEDIESTSKGSAEDAELEALLHKEGIYDPIARRSVIGAIKAREAYDHGRGFRWFLRRAAGLPEDYKQDNMSAIIENMHRSVFRAADLVLRSFSERIKRRAIREAHREFQEKSADINQRLYHFAEAESRKAESSSSRQRSEKAKRREQVRNELRSSVLKVTNGTTYKGEDGAQIMNVTRLRENLHAVMREWQSSFLLPRTPEAYVNRLKVRRVFMRVKRRFFGYEGDEAASRALGELHQKVIALWKKNGVYDLHERTLVDIEKRFIIGEDCDCEYVMRVIDGIIDVLTACITGEKVPPDIDCATGEPARKKRSLDDALSKNISLPWYEKPWAKTEWMKTLFKDAGWKPDPATQTPWISPRSKRLGLNAEQQNLQKRWIEDPWNLDLLWQSSVGQLPTRKLLIDLWIGHSSPSKSYAKPYTKPYINAKKEFGKRGLIGPEEFNLTTIIFDVIAAIANLFTGGNESGESVLDNVFDFITNTNLDEEEGEVGLLFYLLFPLLCNFESNIDCSRGLGIKKGYLYTIIFYAILIFIIGDLFPFIPELWFAILTFDPELPLVRVVPIIPAGISSVVFWTIIFSGLTVSFYWSPRCFPALPICLANEICSLLRCIFVPCILWPAGCLVNPMAAGTCLPCPERNEFVDCEELGFTNIFANILFAIARWLPGVYDFLIYTCIVGNIRTGDCLGPLIPFAFIRQLLIRFDYGDDPIPAADEACFWKTLFANIWPAIFIIWLVSKFLEFFWDLFIDLFRKIIAWIRATPLAILFPSSDEQEFIMEDEFGAGEEQLAAEIGDGGVDSEESIIPIPQYVPQAQPRRRPLTLRRRKPKGLVERVGGIAETALESTASFTERQILPRMSSSTSQSTQPSSVTKTKTV